jgi:formate dehydrogenase major subunit
VCPYCGVGCQLTYHIKDDKLSMSAAATAGQPEPALRQGRFGFDYVSNPQRLTQPLIRKDGVGKAPTIWSIRPTRGRISARRPGRRRLTAPPRVW